MRTTNKSSRKKIIQITIITTISKKLIFLTKNKIMNKIKIEIRTKTKNNIE